MDHTITRRVLSALLAASLTASAVPAAFAEEPRDEELVSALLSYSEEYPDGAFAFREGQLSAYEDEGTAYVDVVRYGSFDGEAQVKFKALDVSAVYGKDYTLSVDEGWFLSRTLDQDEEAVPLMDMYDGAESELIIGEQQLKQEDENTNDVEIALDPDEGITQITSNVPKEEELKGIRAGAAAYTGEVPDKHSWQDITDAESAEKAELAEGMDEVPEYLSELGEGMPGAECVLNFADGEYLKRVKVNLISDGISESDEQAAFLLYSPEGADIAKPQSAYINILDSDENEQVVFAIEQQALTVTPADEYVSVTVKRISGKEKFASVSVGTGAITAEPDVDYKSGSIEVIFPQGIETRTVKVPVYNAYRTEPVSFAVSLDRESAFIDEDNYAAAVTILPDYSEESMEQYSAVLSEAAGTDVVTEVFTADDAEDAVDGTAELSESFDESYSGSRLSRTSVESPRNATTGYGDYVTAVSGLDLRNADSITVYYNLNGYYTHTYSYKDGCKTKTATDTYYERQAQFKVGSATVTTPTSYSSGGDSSSVPITDFPRQANQTLQFQVRKVKNHGDNNHWVTCTISKIVINYHKITLSVDNTKYSGNTYVEKIYRAGSVSTDQGLGYYSSPDDGTILLGTGYADGNSAIVDVNKFTSPVNLNVKDISGQKTKAGVSAKIGTNVYLAGWQYLTSKNQYSDEIIPPDELTLEKLLQKRGNTNYYSIRPVLKPYASMIRFNNSYDRQLAYTNSITTGKEIGVTMLDTLEIEAIPINQSGYAVKTFLVNGYTDVTSHASMGSKRAAQANDIAAKSKNASDRTSFLNAHKNATNRVLYDYNEADSNKIVIKPNCEAIYMDMTYTTPKIDVKFNPSSATPLTYKDMGSVFYANEETKTAVSGKYGQPMTIQPVNYGETYTINAAYEDVNNPDATAAPEGAEEKVISDYKTIWQDFTGDVDGNGELSPAEAAALSRYGLDRSSFTGDAFVYKPKVTNSSIYYYFTKREKVRGDGGIYGAVLLRDHPVFGDKAETITPINGATVSVDGQSVATHYDEQYGGGDGHGGDGYFEIRDNTFVAGEAHRVSVDYGPLSAAGVSNVNVASNYILDAYDTINIDSAAISKNGNVMKPADALLNDDATYKFTFGTVSSISAKVATKAALRFYRKDGSAITKVEYDSTTPTSGVFECSFNPKTLSIPPGATMTIQFTDNEGVEYFEHDLGKYFTQSLGAISLLSSFPGGQRPVFQLVGMINAAFDLGWDGNLDDTSGKAAGDKVDYSIETTQTQKVLSLNISLKKDGKIDDKKPGATAAPTAKPKEDKETEDGFVIVDEDEIKEAAKGEDDAKKKDLADKADQKKKKTEAKVTNSYKLELSFGFKLTLKSHEDGEHKGEWYFEEFLIVVNAGAEFSVSTKYVTPVGITITVGVKVGAKATAIIGVEGIKNREFYMADLMSGNNGTVDVISKSMDKDYSQYFYPYGDFTISPYVELSVEVGWSGFSAELSGRLQINFNYNTTSEVFKGDLEYECSLKIEILLFSKKWKLGAGKVDLFSTGGVSELLGDDSMLYGSLSDFEVSKRENLENRTEWNGGGGDAQLMAVAGLNETDLMSGINNNPTTKLMPLGEGRYIAVYTDDVPERDANNSLAVFYTVFNGTEWSRPQIIEDDGTTDDAPSIADVGDGRLFIAWSTLNQVFEEEPGVLEAVNARNIHGVFFDKAAAAFDGDIIEVTHNTNEDYAGDIDPHIAYDDETNRMIIYYTKEEYSATDLSSLSAIEEETDNTDPDNQGVYGDLTYPESLIAYRLYDVANNEFIDYSADEENEIVYNLGGAMSMEEYKENFYSQRFLSLAPTVLLDQQLDNNGFRNSDLITSEYTGTNDPIIMETEAIGYNHLGLFAYVIDYDGRKDTTSDRDIFLQIYNFEEDSVTHPIMLTQNSAAVLSEDEGDEPNVASALHFERIGGENGITYLSYLNSGEIRMINISENISNENVLRKAEMNGETYYYLDKSEETGYRPEMTVVAAEAAGDYKGDLTITDFDLRSNKDYFYVMFTERGTKPKEGIKEGSDEAADPKNRVLETQVYMKRYDIANGQFTNPVQVTETEGMNYGSIAFAVEEDGFRALASRCGTVIEKMNDTEVLVPDSDNTTLCMISFKPDANVELRNAEIEDIIAGADAAASFEVYNGGIESIDGLTVTAVDGNGNELAPVYVDESTEAALAGYDESTGSVSLIGGEAQRILLSLPVAEDGNSASFTATVKDKDGNVLDTITKTEAAARRLDVTSFDAEIIERGKLRLNVRVTNNEKVDSGDQYLMILDENDETVFETDVESLKPDETAMISDEVEFDYSRFLKEKENEDGSVTAEAKLTAMAGGEQKEAAVSLYATNEQMARLNAVEDVAFGAAQGGAQLSDAVQVKVAQGELLDLDPQLRAGEYKGGRIDDNNESPIDAQGVIMMWHSLNEDVAKVYDSGYIEGIADGKTTIIAELYPADISMDGNEDTFRYATLPRAAIRTYSIEVEVGEVSDAETKITSADVARDAVNGRYDFYVGLSNASEGGKLIGALYDMNGKLIKAETVELSADDTYKAFSITADGADQAKIMVWDGLNTQKPLCSSEARNIIVR